MAKYEVCENLHLLEKYEINQLSLRVNSRCYRMFDKTGLCDSVVRTEYIDVYGDKALISRKIEELHFDKNEDGSYSIWVPCLMLAINKDNGILSLEDSKHTVLLMSKNEVHVGIPYNVNTKKVFDFIKNDTPSDFLVHNLLKRLATLGLPNSLWNLYDLNKFLYENNNTLFQDEDVFNKYSKALKSLLFERNIVNYQVFCKYFGLHELFLEALENDTFSRLNLSQYYYSNEMDKINTYPKRLIYTFLYYFKQGKIDMVTISRFIQYNPSSFFKDEDVLEATICFIKKNLYYGEHLGGTLNNLIRHLKRRNLPITLENLQPKKLHMYENLKSIEMLLGNEDSDAIFNEWHASNNITQAFKKFLGEAR